jgi:sugar phosphate isomerase/epimerase
MGAQSPPAKGSFRLGSVTYNLLQGFDVEAIIKTLEAVGFEAVELRTSHKHGIEPSISAEERVRIRRRFESSKVRLLSYGTTCRFQSPDAPERKQQLEIAKQFVDLAHDTGALGIKLQPMGLPPNVPQETSIVSAGLKERRFRRF